MSTPESGDLLLVNRGGVNYQIDYDDMSTLEDTDLLLVNRGGTNYQIEAQYISTGGNGVIVPEVEVLTPLDRAGDPELTYLKSDRIVAVESEGGAITYETDTIQSVGTTDYESGVVVSGVAIFPSQPLSNLFDGDLSTFVQANSVGVLTFDVSAWGFSDVKVKARVRNTGAGFTYSVNGSPMTLTDIGNDQAEFETTISGALQTLTASTDSQDAFWYGIYIDDVLLVDNEAILTFPTSNNFDKFAVGDVAQAFGVTYEVPALDSLNSFTVGGDPFAVAGQYISGFRSTGSASITFTFDTPADFSTVAKWSGGSYSAGVTYTISFTDHNGTVTSGNSTTTNGYGIGGLPIAPPPLVKSFTIEGADGFALYGFYSDNSNFVVTGNLADVIEITAIDSDANTITVDGGDWLDPSSQDASQEWTSYGIGTPYSSNNDWDKAFNGEISTSDSVAFAAGGQTMTWTPTTPITVNSQLIVYIGGFGVDNCLINGSPIKTMPGNLGTPVSYTAAELGGQLTSIALITDPGLTGAYLTAVEIDGKILLDASLAGASEISKTISYSTKLTLAGDTDLAQMALGPAVMTDGVLGGSGYSQTPYTLTTTDIDSVSGTAPAITLSFPGDVSTNPDLRYFEEGDVLKRGWNQSQVWSTYGTFTGNFTGNYDWSGVFSEYDNNSDTGSLYLTSGVATWTLASPLNCTSSVTFRQFGNISYTINAGRPDETTATSTGGNAYHNLEVPFTGLIYSIQVNTVQTYFIRMFVDGKALIDQGITGDPELVKVVSTDLAANMMTVDGGEWYAVETFDFNHLTDITQLGSPTTFETEGYSSPDSTLAGRFDPAVGSGAELNFDPPIAVANKVSLNCSSSSGAVEIVINDGEATGAYPTTRSLVDIAFTGNVSKIRLQRTAGYDAAYCDGIFFDDVRLVDQAYRSNTLASTPLPGGTGDIVEIDQANNAVYLTEGDRAWIPSNNFAGTEFALAAGSLDNPPAPDYLDIAFTSMNAGTTPFTGVNATLSSRTWTLETAPDKAGPWTLVDTYEEFDMLGSQDGATEWTTGKPVLNQSTWYRVKVTYNSTAAESVESDYHVFKTAV